MAATQVKSVMPGVLLRTGTRVSSIRFACMIKGQRFQEACGLPVDLLLDHKTHKPTRILKDAYAKWVTECEEKAGIGSPFGSRVPSIKELFEKYIELATERSLNPDYAKPSQTSIENTAKNFKLVKEASGLTDDAPWSKLVATDMIRKIFAKLSERMKGVSAWSYIVSLQTITAHWTRVKYQDIGWKVDRPVMPDVGKAKNPPRYHRPSEEMIRAMENWYVSLMDHPDQNLYLAASMVFQLAIRPNDVGRLTKANFVPNEDGYVHLVYTPHKTKESSGVSVDWPILPALWERIRAIAGERLDAGELLLPAWKWKFHRLNILLREACHMWDSTKACYELRKRCIDEVFRQKGIEYAVAISGDRRETIEYYYADPHKLVGVTPLAIAPVGIGPAKS